MARVLSSDSRLDLPLIHQERTFLRIDQNRLCTHQLNGGYSRVEGIRVGYDFGSRANPYHSHCQG